MNHSALSWSEASIRRLACAPLLVCAAAFIGSAHADELKTISGERLVGKIVSVSDKTVHFHSSTLGPVNLARTNVAAITLTPSVAQASAAVSSNQVLGTASATNDYAALLRSLPAPDPETGGSVQDLLRESGPEATAKFNQMVRGLVSGSMSVAELRAEAKSVRDQARALRAELDEDTGAILDGYLAILDKFLGEAAAQPGKNSKSR